MSLAADNLPPESPLRDRVALRLVPKLKRVQLGNLYRDLKGVSNILDAPASKLKNALRPSNDELMKALLNARENSAIDSELEEMERLGATLIEYSSPEYPTLLRLAPNPPMLLYRRGTASTDDARAVALVGTRKATQYGKLTARSLGRSLAMSGIVVVSGFAYGIDIECMLGAVRAGGRSIGVLGCGLSVTYPAENQKYIDEILESGAFYSEYPMTTKGRSHQFPERNTVMAGMTLGTCVIEAKEKSGALITADCALEAGRSVMAVPGDITRDNSRGANQLIQAGAKLVTSSEDILEELAPLLRQLMPKRKGDDSTQSEKNDDKSSAVKADDFADQLADLPEQVEKKAASPKEASKDLPSKKPETPAAALKGLSEEARLVLEQLAHEPQYWDDLMQHPDLSGKPYNELANMMLDLTMRGLIIEQPGKLYLLKQPL